MESETILFTYYPNNYTSHGEIKSLGPNLGVNWGLKYLDEVDSRDDKRNERHNIEHSLPESDTVIAHDRSKEGFATILRPDLTGVSSKRSKPKLVI